MAISTIYQRMAELYVKMGQSGLNESEQIELDHCMRANVEICWKIAKLEEMSYLAHVTNDVEWQHEICAQIEQLNFGIQKKPGRKATD